MTQPINESIGCNNLGGQVEKQTVHFAQTHLRFITHYFTHASPLAMQCAWDPFSKWLMCCIMTKRTDKDIKVFQKKHVRISFGSNWWTYTILERTIMGKNSISYTD